MKRIWLALLLWGLAALAGAQTAIPPFQQRVTDLTHTLSAREQWQLSDQLQLLEERKGSQVVVLIVAQTLPETIEQYSLRVAESWKLGRKGVDDGVLILVVKNDHKARIEVGYGLEGTLTDVACSQIIRERMAPALQDGRWAEGIQQGVTQVTTLINGGPLPTHPPSPTHAASALVTASAVAAVQPDAATSTSSLGLHPFFMFVLIACCILASFKFRRWVCRTVMSVASLGASLLIGQALTASILQVALVLVICVILQSARFWAVIVWILERTEFTSGNDSVRGSADDGRGKGGGFGGGGASG
ncbi:TPM domain-containing protein [Andreprevotia chitinilytica]|uniref:TPM domain-containing protein n=1 Tax=Andreprevotia chitinilytica TaxID=396808 RepID=UPI000553AB11|nr:TPM domain-containing protein [Andreprevotia chitinilytica]